MLLSKYSGLIFMRSSTVNKESWLPNRCCLIEHLGHAEFRIVEALNTKLSIDDTFTCHIFINNEPAYLDNLTHNGQGPRCCVADRQSGVLVVVFNFTP